jgi:homoserine O-acetyltransferase
VPVTLLGIEEDQLVPLADMRELRDRLAGGCQLIEISSLYGHDAFLKEKDVMRDLLAQALA